MSITVLNYLDQSLVDNIHAQAAERAAAALRTATENFADVLDQSTQALSSEYPSAAPASSAAETYSSNELDHIFEEAAATYGVSVNLLKSIAKAESGFQTNAVSSAGAVGIMQLMPATAASLGVTNSYNAKENIMGGARLISQLLAKYNGNTSLALAAYNAGSGNVDKYGGIPPFTETQNYVQKVLSYMGSTVTVPSGNSTISSKTESAREEASQLIGSILSSSNINNETLELLAELLKIDQSQTSGNDTADVTAPSDENTEVTDSSTPADDDPLSPATDPLIPSTSTDSTGSTDFNAEDTGTVIPPAGSSLPADSDTDGTEDVTDVTTDDFISTNTSETTDDNEHPSEQTVNDPFWEEDSGNPALADIQNVF